MQHPMSFRVAARLSALSLLICPYTFALAQNAVAGFDVFVTPTDNEVVNAGSNFDIIWTPSDPAGPVTIRLMQGATELTQEFGPTIASGIDSTSGKYTWSIPSSYGNYATYGFKLQLDSDPTIFQYSYPFIINKISSPTSASPPPTQVPATSTAVATSTSILVVTQNTIPNNPSTQKQQTSAQSAAPSSNLPNAQSSAISSATKADTSSPTSAPSGSSSSAPSSTVISDLSSISPTGASSQTGTGASSAASSAPASTAASGDQGLSVGAKAGIAIGSVAGVCIIGLLAYIALLTRRKSARREVDGVQDEHKMAEMGPGLAHEIGGVEKASELETGGPFQVGLKDENYGERSRLEDIAEMG